MLDTWVTPRFSGWSGASLRSVMLTRTSISSLPPSLVPGDDGDDVVVGSLVVVVVVSALELAGLVVDGELPLVLSVNRVGDGVPILVGGSDGTADFYLQDRVLRQVPRGAVSLLEDRVLVGRGVDLGGSRPGPLSLFVDAAHLDVVALPVLEIDEGEERLEFLLFGADGVGVFTVIFQLVPDLVVGDVWAADVVGGLPVHGGLVAAGAGEGWAAPGPGGAHPRW